MSPCRILLTGPPGIGKTTLIKKIAEKLEEKKVAVCGFYTEEIRVGGKRTGFDVVKLGKTGDERGSLARAGPGKGGPRVGQYNVTVGEFERVALGTIKDVDAAEVVIIDEIGKMELFSKDFVKSVEELFAKREKKILCTVPVAKIPLVERLKACEGGKIVTVTKDNRDRLAENIADELGK